MTDIHDVAGKALKYLKESGADRFSVNVSEDKKQELNYSDRFDLFRTAFGQNLSIRAFCGKRMGTAAGNDLTEDGIVSLVKTAVAAAQAAGEDEANDIAPDAGRKISADGPQAGDMDRLYASTDAYIRTVEERYPEIVMYGTYAAYEHSHGLYLNSGGTSFETSDGMYSFYTQFAANNGEKTTSLNEAKAFTRNPDTPFADLPNIRRGLKTAVDSLTTIPFSGKFTGTVILTPDAAYWAIRDLIQNYASGKVLMEGTSLWRDLEGKSVADEKLTLKFDPHDSRIVTGRKITPDGFPAEAVTVIEKGVLKNYMLSLYEANKTGRKPTKNEGSGMIVAPGNLSLEEMIRSVDRGLILGWFSGGHPSSNGEFSGVAKNSFLIEGGRIAGPVTEVMINGNLGEVFRHITGITAETEDNGESSIPYIAAEGVVISGK